MKVKTVVVAIAAVVVLGLGTQFGIKTYLKNELDKSITEVLNTGQLSTITYDKFEYDLLSNSATISGITVVSSQYDNDIEFRVKKTKISDYDFSMGAALSSTLEDIKVIYNKKMDKNQGLSIGSIESKGSHVVDGVIQKITTQVNKISFMPGRDIAKYNKQLKLYNLTPEQAYANLEMNLDQNITTNEIELSIDLDMNKVSRFMTEIKLDSVPIKELTATIEEVQKNRTTLKPEELNAKLLPLISAIVLKSASVTHSYANDQVKNSFIKSTGQTKQEVISTVEMMLPLVENNLIQEKKPETLKLVKTVADYVTSNKQSITLKMGTEQPISALLFPIMMAYSTEDTDEIIKTLNIKIETK